LVCYSVARREATRVVLNHSASGIVVLRVVFAVLLLATVADAQWLNHPSPAIPRLPDGKPNLSAPAPTAPDGPPSAASPALMPASRKACSSTSREI
jgi:hypothetical protein